MPAVSKAQQRFMGMVHAVKKGEMAAPSPEVAQAAASMKKKDAKDFASTKHKGLPSKVEVKEAGDYWHPDPKKDAQISGAGNKARAREDRAGSSKPTAKPDPKKLRKGESYMDYAKRQKGSSSVSKPKDRKRDKIGRALGRAIDRIGGIKSEGWSAKYKKSIDCDNPKGFSQRAHCQGKEKVNEIYSNTDAGRSAKYARDDKEKKQFAKDDKRKKYGKFIKDIETARGKGKGMRGTHKGKWGTFNKGVFTPDS
jgi:hypothetical protein